MGMLENEDLARLRIDRMIFHVVGPEENDLTLMDEVEIEGFEPFFLERIRETNVGNRFEFIGINVGVRPSLAAINEEPENFVTISKALAETFQNLHENTAKKGAFIVAKLSGLATPTFALIKFDDLRVLRFLHQTTGGTVTATVSEVENTFQEDKKAMQKSALILLDDEGGSLAVYDRTNRRDVTKYFRNFLGAKRLYDGAQATERLKTALTEAYQKHLQEMPQEVKSTWRTKLYEATRNLETLDTEDMGNFMVSVFGEYGINERFKATIASELQRQKISGEAIEIAPAMITKPAVRQVKTQEGIQVRIPDGKDGLVNLDVHDDGHATITIQTRRITSNELVDEAAIR
ncbi:nucleoid-associated protein [Agrobacterium tumefaciens]|uniref:nucleoid-associated protein n=1 Tax=Agrobacterium tumefaciens TaxID=358 RepID=UPI00061874C1|nr:nucleoid-associated protein [Agrobacterium tumefaciens]AKC07225.1 hypothetical protein Ach5_14490 [Agrobacterium tumefaciens]AYM67366.1 hypothetical protein AtA6_11490 [Agrobacterium tumefaciens]NIB54955.1 nucleoid-associated protein [Agrobacterium tumefaciens]NSZ21672.1 nucleoid-associated protein [Agrobacterium tumefaciens]QQE32564.1 nucleoid-associated protein [Agrobacterium tumefaciens]